MMALSLPSSSPLGQRHARCYYRFRASSPPGPRAVRRWRAARARAPPPGAHPRMSPLPLCLSQAASENGEGGQEGQGSVPPSARTCSSAPRPSGWGAFFQHVPTSSRHSDCRRRCQWPATPPREALPGVRHPSGRPRSSTRCTILPTVNGPSRQRAKHGAQRDHRNPGKDSHRLPPRQSFTVILLTSSRAWPSSTRRSWPARRLTACPRRRGAPMRALQ